MAFSVSPGVQVSEYDLTQIVPAVSTSIGAIAGIFNWGPVNQITLVPSENGGAGSLYNVFGKPNSNNAETWFSGANFLAYTNALNVVRVIDGATTACVNSGAIPANTAILNLNNYLTTVANNNIQYYAKYPSGTIGNSLEISVCDSTNAYQIALNNTTLATAGIGNTNVSTFNLALNSGSNLATVTIQSTSVAGSANDAMNKLFSALIANGDVLAIGNTTIGIQNMNVTGWTISETETANSGTYTTTATVNLGNFLNLPANFSGNTVTRYWQYWNQVSGAPATTYSLHLLGLTTVDQVHVVVVDNLGQISGTPGTVLEVFSGLSRATDAVSETNTSRYYKTVLQNQSNYVWLGVDRAGAVSNTSANLVGSTNQKALTQAFVGGSDGNAEGNCSLTAITNGWNMFADPTAVTVNLLIQGKARGISAESSPSSNSNNYSTLTNYILSNIATTRMDCMLFFSPANVDVVNALNPLTNVIAFNTNVNLATSYGAQDTGYKYQYDEYNDVYRWIPLNGDCAGLCAYTDYVRDPWYSPAGFNRGNIKNVTKLAYNPVKADRDQLYQAYINPVVTFPGQGTVLYGDKTIIDRSSAFNRINVRRLFIVIEKAIAIAAQAMLFEFNNSFTQTRFKNMLNPYLRQIEGAQGIQDFLVVCDATNNTPQVIDANQFVGDIYIKPSRSINFIQLNFIAVGTGVQFSEVVGAADALVT